ncbi:hypothetical protein TNCV_4195191 [Trichonephila clavipes]|nr:hypothetical protein TNCV_4195191 [Trichonephila clavipes]
MPERKKGLTTEEVEKVLADLEDEILDDKNFDWALENEEDDLDQSLNLYSDVEDDVIFKEQSKIVWDDPQLIHKATILPFTGNNVTKGATVPCVTESDFFNCIFQNSIVRKITDETNIRATRVLQSATQSSLRKHNTEQTETNNIL